MSDPRSSEVLTRQWIAVQRAGTGIGLDMQALTKKLFVALRREISAGSSPAVMAAAMTKIIKKASPAMSAVLYKDLKKLADLMVKNAHAQAVALGSTAKAPVISDTRMKAWMSKAPMAASGTTMTSLYQSTVASMATQVEGAVLLAQTQADGIRALRARLRDVEAQVLRNMMTTSRTSTNHVANMAKQFAYSSSTRWADRVIWVATLDHRTSPFCQLADGKVFPIDKGPRPPAHVGCRSTIALVGKGEKVADVKKEMEPRPAVVPKSKEMLDKQTLHTKKSYNSEGVKTRGGKVRKPRRNDTSPLKGTTTHKQTYETWMKSQPKYYQEAVLGKSSAKRFRGGESLTTVLKDTRSSINFDSLGEALAQ